MPQVTDASHHGEPVTPASSGETSPPLAMALFRACVGSARDRTVLFAPGGAVAALRLLAAGAAGQTQQQLQAVTAATAAVPELPTGNIAGSPPQTPMLRLANCLWLPKHLHPSDSIRAALVQQEVEATLITSAAEDAPAQINAWCAEATDRLIPTIIADPPDPDGFLIANAISFTGTWEVPFDAALTAPGIFHQRDGTTVNVPFMRRSGWFNYARVAGGQLIELAYSDLPLSLTICLPDRVDGMSDWLDAPDSWTFDLHGRVGDLCLPRLDLAFEMDLRSLLSQVGVTDAFSPERADFSALTVERAPLFVAALKQKLAIKLDEAGTRAAAVTRVEMLGAAPVILPPFEMTVDRPFFFAIRGRGRDRPILFLVWVESL